MTGRSAEESRCEVEATTTRTPRTPRTPPRAQPFAPRARGAGLVERACTAFRRRYVGSREVVHGRRHLVALHGMPVQHDDAAEGGAP